MFFSISSFRLSGIFVLTLLLSACSTAVKLPGTNSMAKNNQPAGQLVWHDLITYDIEAARRFYGGLFGWKFEKSAPREGHPYVLAKLDRRYAGGLLQIARPARDQQYARWLGYMTVSNIDTALSTTYSDGGGVIETTRNLGEVGKAAAIKDPEGAVLGLIETRMKTQGLILTEAPGAIVWNELLATNLRSAAAFYSKLATYTATTIQRRGGEYTLLESNSLKQAGLMQNPFDQTDPAWLSYFAVSDLEASVSRVRELGGTVILAPSAELREGTIALVLDPDRAILALQKWPL